MTLCFTSLHTCCGCNEPLTAIESVIIATVCSLGLSLHRHDSHSLTLSLLVAFSKDFSHQTHFGQETATKPTLAAVDSHANGQYHSVECQASSLAPNQVGIVSKYYKERLVTQDGVFGCLVGVQCGLFGRAQWWSWAVVGCSFCSPPSVVYVAVEPSTFKPFQLVFEPCSSSTYATL